MATRRGAPRHLGAHAPSASRGHRGGAAGVPRRLDSLPVERLDHLRVAAVPVPRRAGTTRPTGGSCRDARCHGDADPPGQLSAGIADPSGSSQGRNAGGGSRIALYPPWPRLRDRRAHHGWSSSTPRRRPSNHGRRVRHACDCRRPSGRASPSPLCRGVGRPANLASRAGEGGRQAGVSLCSMTRPCGSSPPYCRPTRLACWRSTGSARRNWRVMATSSSRSRSSFVQAKGSATRVCR